MALKKKPVTGMKDILPKEMEIRFDHVWFKYPGTENYIYKDFKIHKKGIVVLKRYPFLYICIILIFIV